MDELTWEESSRADVQDTDLPGFRPPFQVIALTNSAEWETFDQRMSHASAAGSAPWRRVLSVLREHGAVVCVVEENYVCLDYRSELATFYAQLDQPIANRSIRLHFFSTTIGHDDLFALSEEAAKKQADAYLGYVVCRSGGLPLVGRTVIKKPDYIEESAAVTDTVYLFGRRLRVTGVPFLQQDNRFAVCAQVAAWEANYSAYRRGLVARSLIADFATPSKGFRPMRPGGQRGLVANQVADIFSETGMRSEIWYVPGDGQSLLPEMDPRLAPELLELADACVQRLANDRLAQQQESDKATADLEEVSQQIRKTIETNDVEEMIQKLVAIADEICLLELPPELIKLIDAAIARAALPYIRSRFPIYCDTHDHAVLLCGLSRATSTDPVFFFHDDQLGPYLASTSAYAASKEGFQYQAGLISGSDENTAMGRVQAHDRTAEVIQGGVRFSTADRGIRTMVTACPSRALLGPSVAEIHAFELIQKIAPELVDQCERRVLVIMGTDYKDSRLRQLPADSVGAWTLLASMHLAEWVVVVEGVTDEGVVTWEAVFDGTSGADSPALQFARYGSTLVYVPPKRHVCILRTETVMNAAGMEGDGNDPTTVSLSDCRAPAQVLKVVPEVQVLDVGAPLPFSPIKAPSRVGKGRSESGSGAP